MKVFILFFISFLFQPSFGQSLSDLHIMTEQYPPLNYERHGKLRGISVDILEEIFIELGLERRRDSINIYPWPRAYNMIQHNSMEMLFSMVRTDEREMMFKWVGPITSSEIVLFAKKSRNIVINDQGDLVKYSKIGVVKSDIGELLLKSKMNVSGDQLYFVKNSEAGINMLTAGRIDMFAYERIVGLWNVREIGLNPDDYEVVYILSANDYYYAFSKDIPDSIIKKIQEAFDRLKKSGAIDKAIKNYF